MTHSNTCICVFSDISETMRFTRNGTFITINNKTRCCH